jgi:hypothetical protein
LGLVALACAAAVIPATVSLAGPAVAVPLNCAADPDQPGCHPDEGGGAGTSDGRAFLITADVISISASSMTIFYDSSEWSSWQDVKEAVEDWWDIHSPLNRVCDFNSGCALTASNQGDRVVFRFHH